ncbi:uncharacterized protein I303_102797 [Kwoniella dejecticola CBS 10117]|uniref:Template-activating factor I n=1 Tax=Kwoniella dejecticola CBS 10117 TaxID=1296121 RepID=A0A1A6A9Q7_9TREE|nr:template-activating factor I [Kwoniella dejecticola CBS 10117]OBR86797.1 template-activating factor I [Kwoniella dejecticola CBS 10117]
MSAQDFELEPVDLPKDIERELEIEEGNKNVRHNRFYVQETETYLKHLRPRVKGINQFWLTTLLNHTQIAAAATSKADQHALSFLEDVELVQDVNDFRPFELKFHFKENPYFSNTVLSKKYSLRKGVEPAPKDGSVTDELRKFEGIDDLVPERFKIDWKTDEVNLPKKQPRVVQRADNEGDAAEDEGDFEGDLGSFFIFFENDEDILQLGDAIRSDILPDAFAYFQDRGDSSPGQEFGLDSDDDVDDDDEDDELDEESDDDAEAEIDLEDEEDEKPKKKRRLGKGKNGGGGGKCCDHC